MLWGVLVGFALARLYATPVANAPPQTAVPRFAPVIQPQPQVIEVQMPQYVAQQSSRIPSAMGVAALVVGFMGGRQAMLFSSSGKSKPKPKAKPVARTAAKSAPAKPKSPAKYGVIDLQDRPRNRDTVNSLYASRKNVQTQRSGFGSFRQKFQIAGNSKADMAKSRSKYGMPLFTKEGNINPAYLAAERAEMQKKSRANTAAAEIKRKGLIASKSFELADYVRKKVGNVGSGAEYYQSGR